MHIVRFQMKLKFRLKLKLLTLIPSPWSIVQIQNTKKLSLDFPGKFQISITGPNNCGEMKLDANVRIAWESDFAKCAEFCKKIQNEKSEFFLSFLSSQVLHIEFSQDWHTNIHARLKQLWMRLILSFQWFLQAHSVSNNLWHMTLNSSAGCLSFYLGLRTRKMDK